ncbi:LIV-I protein F [Delftia tsuruhatensis]|uniref:ABC transporter ATP-binding protein n=1 Tax=Delftia tsuruhatensis TaxID=180282 RepID=UPI001E703AEB|nr:ABC transporter ATP-binding protein [Delftia tsuruhatensis]CAB5695132.1 LIV-I protein F [Delftia tsuruhatensis]CAC9686998.1 LIV-I protein F [Delftia tsuruhatensis]
MAEAAVLDIRALNAWYGESHVLHGVDLQVGEAELVTLVGRNGAGRSTTLRAIMGLTGTRKGSVRIHGKETIALPTFSIARCGVGYCPEERGIFSGLSVTENLMLPPPLPGGRPMSVQEIHDLFPNLAHRGATQGTRLSGGEQQMLALARILRTGARLLLLDEISEGLAPAIVEQIGVALQALKRRGYTILLVEQNFEFVQTLADRFYVMEHGRIVEHFRASELPEKAATLNERMGV